MNFYGQYGIFINTAIQLILLFVAPNLASAYVCAVAACGSGDYTEEMMQKLLFATCALTFSAVLGNHAIAGECSLEKAGFTSKASVQALLDEKHTVVPKTIMARDREVRVHFNISSADGKSVLDAMGLDLEVDPDGNGKVPVVHLVYRERRKIEVGDCAGLNTKEYMAAITFFLLGRDSTKNFNLPVVSWLADAPVPVIPYFEANSKIRIAIQNDTDQGMRRLAIETTTRSADKHFDLSIALEFEGELPFAKKSADLKAARFPLFGRRPDGAIDRIWCSTFREVARLRPDDPGLKKLEVRTGKGDRLCFNQLKNSDGKPVCVRPLTNDRKEIIVTQARISRYAGLGCAAEPL